MSISPARIAAFEILKRIETERAFSSILLPEFEAKLSGADRGLCHELTLGVLRRQMLLDRMIDQFAGGKKIDLAVRISLRLGLYQLKFLDRIPSHSAVNESVNLVNRAKKTSAKGFVNAVLRRSMREAFETEYVDETDRVAVETSHPRWLIEKWIAVLGLEDAIRLAVANNEAPSTAFRLTAKAPKGLGFADSTPSSVVAGSFVAGSASRDMIDAAQKGEIYFQDEASQLTAASIDLMPNDRFLDVCAAPGSKVTQIASRYSGGSNLIAAGDLHAHRVRFLAENCTSQKVGVEIVRYDAESVLPFQEGSFDALLVDAPCSGTGTIRHNPEIRYFVQSDDLGTLVKKQRHILQNASKLVRTGGYIVYSTCSVEPEEGEEVAAYFLSVNSNFELADPCVPDRFRTQDGFARTFPHRDGMDGFFIARFRRTDKN